MHCALKPNQPEWTCLHVWTALHFRLCVIIILELQLRNVQLFWYGKVSCSVINSWDLYACIITLGFINLTLHLRSICLLLRENIGLSSPFYIPTNSPALPPDHRCKQGCVCNISAYPRTKDHCLKPPPSHTLLYFAEGCSLPAEN